MYCGTVLDGEFLDMSPEAQEVKAKSNETMRSKVPPRKP